MGARGRKSKTEVEVAKQAGAGAAELVGRPGPPPELSDEQAEVWQVVVSRMPADWFPEETHALLAAYCRHVVAARHVGQLIAQQEKDASRKNATLDIDAYDKLLKMQEREGRAMSSLATRMRITQQTQYDKSRKRGSQVTPPWEI